MVHQRKGNVIFTKSSWPAASFWQLSVPPVTKMSSKWRHIRYFVLNMCDNASLSFPLKAAQKVIKITTFGATSGENFVKMTFPYQWYSWYPPVEKKQGFVYTAYLVPWLYLCVAKASAAVKLTCMVRLEYSGFSIAEVNWVVNSIFMITFDARLYLTKNSLCWTQVGAFDKWPTFCKRHFQPHFSGITFVVFYLIFDCSVSISGSYS